MVAQAGPSALALRLQAGRHQPGNPGAVTSATLLILHDPHFPDHAAIRSEPTC